MIKDGYLARSMEDLPMLCLFPFVSQKACLELNHDSIFEMLEENLSRIKFVILETALIML